MDRQLDAAMWASIAEIFKDKDDIDQDKHDAITKCTYCGKERGDTLRSCTRCKAARYCNEKCQRADYKERHRRECADFIDPPRTRAFRTKPTANTKYPNSPIFARGHESSIGCWVSIGGRMTCKLQQLSYLIRPSEGEKQMARYKMVFSQSEKIPLASRRNLLDIRFLVQNRRKDNVPVLIFGGSTQLVTKASQTSSVLRGMIPNDRISTLVGNGDDVAVVDIARDPWDGSFRVLVEHVNNHATHEPPFHKAIQDHEQGIVALSSGDYAIISLQFRIGDDKTISKEWEALRCVDRVIIPFIPWDGVSNPSTLARALPPACTLCPTTFPSSNPVSSAVKTLSVVLDQQAITEFYADYINHGEDAFMRSHHGDGHADYTRKLQEEAASLTERHLRLSGKSMEEVMAELHQAGWGEYYERALGGL